MTEASLTLTPGKDIFTLAGLIERAAAYKCLKVKNGKREFYSEPFATYALDSRVLEALNKRGIKREARPDANHTFITIVDSNPQNPTPGYLPSNYWNFREARNGEEGDEKRISLAVKFEVSARYHGIRIFTTARGTYVSAADHLPNFRMFKALVELGGDAPPVAKELTESERGTIVIGWTELGLGGVRGISELFEEFVRGNQVVRLLARERRVFEPQPYPPLETNEGMFFAEPAQPRLFKIWREQLKDYSESLLV